MRFADLPAVRYNSKWSRAVQDAVLTVLLDDWLGGGLVPGARLGRLLTLEEVGELFQGVYETPLRTACLTG